MTDDIAKSLGFDDAGDFFKMTANVDISTPEKFALFKQWQEADGTKQGLVAIIKENT